MEQTKGRILNKGAMKNFLYILRGVLAGVLLSVIGILLFAFILKTMNAPDGSILIVNMIIKILSVLMGTVVSLSKINGKGYLVGAATGLLYAIISFTIFSLLKGDLTMLNSFWSEVLTAIAAGTISGILIMNIKRK